MLNITESAKKELKEWTEAQQIEDPVLRIIVSGMGWGGPSLSLVQVDSDEHEEGREQDLEKGRIIWDERIDHMTRDLGDIELDYRNSFLNSGFSLNFSGSRC